MEKVDSGFAGSHKIVACSFIGALLLAALAGCGGVIVRAEDLSDVQRASGLKVLGVNDGWAAYGSGTTGGAFARPENITIVSSRQALIKALGGDNATNAGVATSKVIFVRGTINLAEDENGRERSANDWRDPSYDWDAYLKTYDPKLYGNVRKAEGALEEARERSQKNQEKHVVINVGSNTTVIGLGNSARIIKGSLRVKGVRNVIIRNVTFEDAYDYFPEWDPKDGPTGNWNTEYDNLQVMESTNVWVDHCTFTDGERSDDNAPIIFGQRALHHDGMLDITLASNYVTVSNNVFKGHGKTNLIGGSDSRTAEDSGRLRVTFRHNIWDTTAERMPRVRFGEVDVYNNYYKGSPEHAAYKWVYGMGVGFESKIYSESNYFALDHDIPAYSMIKSWKGATFFDKGSVLNGKPVDILKEWNAFAANPANKVTTLTENVGWIPKYRGVPVLPAQDVPAYVTTHAGAGKL